MPRRSTPPTSRNPAVGPRMDQTRSSANAMGLEPTRGQHLDVCPRSCPPPPPPPLPEHRRGHVIYKKVVFEDFHKLWTLERGQAISMPAIQEVGQYTSLRSHFIDAGRLSTETVRDMWNALDVVENPSLTQKEILIVCRNGQTSMHSTTRSKAPPTTTPFCGEDEEHGAVGGARCELLE